MQDNNESASAVSVSANPLWKAPASVADTQKPIKLETTGFDSSFIPYEIEYGVVMDQLSKIYKSWKSTIREYIANAESACMSAGKLDLDYIPEINIVYSPEQCLFTIEDNGIGLSKKMFMEVFRYFGRSRNAFDPTISGMFGLGAKSFVMLVGDKGSMVIHTRSRETDECYKMYARKVGFDVLPHEDRGYGTSFTFVHDPGFNKLQVIKAIGEYSRYVRVPVNFRITGSSVSMDNPDYNSFSNNPRQVIIEPSGPTMISGMSPEMLLDEKIREAIQRTYHRDHGREFIKISYSTEHYDFCGLIDIDISEGCLTSIPSNNTSLLLISMPTEETNQELFAKAVVRIKSETGPDWLPKPTPDRERFEEKSREAFLDKLHADLVERLQTISGESIFYRGSDSAPEKCEFKGIGTIVSYRSYFDLTDVQKIIWRYIFSMQSLKKHLQQQTENILNQLYREVNNWEPSELARWNRRSRRHRNELHSAIETALENNSHVYLAPSNAKKSRTLREKAKAAKAMHGVVLLDLFSSSLPQSLLDELPIFRDLSEIKVESKDRMPDHVAFHEVGIDKYTATSRRSTCQKHIEFMEKLERNQAVAFRNDDNINAYLGLLEEPSHTCPVGLFKATQAQIKWLKSNSKILSLSEYISWAKEQKLATSRGPMRLDHLLGSSSAIFHSIGETAGSRLLNYFKKCPEMIYVPLTGEDYFMAAAAIHFSKPKSDGGVQGHLARQNYKPKIYSSSGLIEHLHLDGKDRGSWSDWTADRRGLWIYSRLVLGDSNDMQAVDAIIRSAPLGSLTRIIDCIVKLRLNTKQHRSTAFQPELLGQLFGQVAAGD